VRLYRRFPELVQGPFRQHVTRQTWNTRQGELLTAAIANGDEAFVDYLAAQAVTVRRSPRKRERKEKAPPAPSTALERLAGYYDQPTPSNFLGGNGTGVTTRRCVTNWVEHHAATVGAEGVRLSPRRPSVRPSSSRARKRRGSPDFR
jgi:hypothetical protein